MIQYPTLKCDSVEVRCLSAVGAIPGVAPHLAAPANGPGIGWLLGEGGELSWRAPGSATFGDAVACASDGVYVLADGEDASKWIRVEVHVDYLSDSSAMGEVFLADVFDNGVAGIDVAAASSAAGETTTRQLTLANADANPIQNICLWLDAASDARTALSLDGETWSSPTTEAGGLSIEAIAAGGSAAIHLRRVVGAGESSVAKQLVFIHFAFDAYPND
jgi:hypothetical protein